MAVTILERPEGYILSPNGFEGDSYDFGGNYQIRMDLPHGLATGSVFYVVSNIGEYNGFFKVGAFDPTEIEVLTLAGENIPFLQETEITLYGIIYTHGWSAVHLPITYRLSTNLYPTNSADTTRNITSVQDANGYTVILLSGSLGSGVDSYDFVKIDAPSDTELSKVYQILEFISPTVMIINLEYDSGNNFTGATALKHYNNYNILVRVYAGINASHQWASEKPYELAATLQFIPDDNNEAFFSINEILKSYIETRNNLVLGTLPNNIDFWTNFYIEVAESYDDSDGYTFGTTTTNYTSDQSNFEGTAVNAKLEFKNIYSGYLSAYLMTNNTAKFLTLFTIPVLFSCSDDTPDCYSDISFISPVNDLKLIIKNEYYSNGVLITTVNETIEDADYGVIRYELSPNCSYDRVDITVFDTPALLTPFTRWSNAGSNPEWTSAGVSLLSDVLGFSSDQFILPFLYHAGVTYTITYQITIVTSGNWDTTTFFASFSPTATGTNHVVDDDTFNTSGVKNGTLVLTPTVTYYGYLRLLHGFGMNAPPATSEITINSLTISFSDIKISETKEFKIDCGCANQEIRLTWLNNLAGFDYWAFTAEKDHIREIQEVITTKKNILPTWPKSYGADADTIRKQTKRVSNKAYTVRSQFLTSDQADALSYIKSSILVQIINSRTDRRTVIVDSDSFIVRKDGDDTFEIAFNISFTDDIPVQTS